MQTRCEEKVVRNLYEMATDEGENILETIFGKSTFNTRPLGVWCYDKSMGKLIKPEDWTNNNVSGGVVVVTDDHAFRVLPHPTFVAQWGNPDKDTALCRDKDTVSGEELTDKIIETYKGVEYKSNRSERYNFIGSPAAEFCKSVGGYLPSVVELQIISKHIDEINRCMRIMGQPTLPIGWYWSSIEEDSSFAWLVYLDDGLTYYYLKIYNFYVRTVSAFQI